MEERLDSSQTELKAFMEANNVDLKTFMAAIIAQFNSFLHTASGERGIMGNPTRSSERTLPCEVAKPKDSKGLNLENFHLKRVIFP